MRSFRIRSIAVAAVAVVGLTAGAGGATAGVPPGTTNVEIKGVQSEPENDFVFVYGRVFALPQQCSKNRQVQLQLNPGSGYETADTGRTTSRGYYGLAGPIEGGVNQIRVVVPKSRIKVGGDRVTCKRAVGFPTA